MVELGKEAIEFIGIDKSKKLLMTGVLTGVLLVGSLLVGGLEPKADSGTESEPLILNEDGTVKDGSFKEGDMSQYAREAYNPTEPEVQLGDVKVVDIDESGTVGLDEESVQGELNDSSDIIVDGVKGKDKIYYVLEKDGDIISVNVEGNKIVGEDDSSIQVKDVNEINGNNGTADKDGFKSNLVPEDVLPKTGLSPEASMWAVAGIMVVGFVGIFVMAPRRKNA